MPRINVAPVSNKKQSDGNDTVTLQFDISGADRSSIRIEVCDYAMNTKNVGALSLAYDISYQLTKTYRDPELTVLTYRIDNRSDEVISCTPIMAFYDKSGKLAGISEASADIAPGSFEYRFYIYKDMSRAETVRLFLWDSPESMEPLSQSVAESLYV